MRVFPIAVLTGCWVAPAAAPPAVVPAPPPVAIAPIVLPPPADPEPATRRTIERYSNRDFVSTHLSRDEVIVLDPGTHVLPRSRPIDLATSELDYLGPCMRDFVKAQPTGARRVLTDVLGHYATTCANNTVTLDAPLGCDGRGRHTRTDAMLVGPLAPGGAGLMLRILSCNSEKAFDRISIESESWTSPRLEVSRQGDCDVAELPVTRALASVLHRAVDRGDAVIKLAGTDNEIAIDSVRDELAGVLAAVDAITVQ